MTLYRCAWSQQDPLLAEYHDQEWGVPLYDDQKLFEFMVLDAFQAGLSWLTILKKREGFRKAFSGFNVKKIALYGTPEIERLLKEETIIRNRLKIQATIQNAQCFLRLQKEQGTFHQYIWSFVEHTPLQNQRKSLTEIPSSSKESDAMSKSLKKEGFKFVGTTICYAFMQASGMVNDHETQCFRYKQIQKLSKPKKGI